MSERHARRRITTVERDAQDGDAMAAEGRRWRKTARRRRQGPVARCMTRRWSPAIRTGARNPANFERSDREKRTCRLDTRGGHDAARRHCLSYRNRRRTGARGCPAIRPNRARCTQHHKRAHDASSSRTPHAVLADWTSRLIGSGVSWIGRDRNQRLETPPTMDVPTLSVHRPRVNAVVDCRQAGCSRSPQSPSASRGWPRHRPNSPERTSAVPSAG
jgi:hypothetical protein